jgi:hypothetical protein
LSSSRYSGTPKQRLIYTGIGSRQTPEPVLGLMVLLGRALARRGWLLRSGGSPGADAAFEKGCDLGGGAKEIYLPWSGFNGSRSPLFETPPAAVELARKIHPGLNRRSASVQKLRARNVCQILGASLSEPSDLVIAWTKNAVPSGGSATVLRIADECGIPVLNLADPAYSGDDETFAFRRVLANAQNIARRVTRRTGIRRSPA